MTTFGVSPMPSQRIMSGQERDLRDRIGRRDDGVGDRPDDAGDAEQEPERGPDGRAEAEADPHAREGDREVLPELSAPGHPAGLGEDRRRRG